MEENHAAGQSRDTLQRPLPTPNTYTLIPLQNTFFFLIIYSSLTVLGLSRCTVL